MKLVYLKKWLAFTCLLMLTASILLLASCADKCKKIICYNGAICVDGICGCTPGFEGDDCSLEVREKFLGTYNVSDNCSVTGNAHYTVNMSAVDTSVTRVAIANFNGDFGNLVIAVISGDNIEIPIQSPDYDGRSVSGAGIFSSGSTIIWNYTIVSSGGIANNCSNSVWQK
ncbi:MAG: calcium-binding EGF-like domain-containing protein [Chitinophagales bacterium]|nr:calcium-binding EGF-like domain-containing protein [Chitinophagales bacterium]